jgi:hypothetical protein
MWPNGHQSGVAYTLAHDGDVPCGTLRYYTHYGEDVRIPIRFESTPAHFGGRRWWFVCPLMNGDMACRRRVRALYLPPGGQYFGCRICNGLTYRSAQEAHIAERRIRQLDTSVLTLRGG